MSLFELGRAVATPGALEALAPEEALVLLRRHQGGDWGDVPHADARENELSVKRGFRVLSSYTAASGAKVWIIHRGRPVEHLYPAALGVLIDAYGAGALRGFGPYYLKEER